MNRDDIIRMAREAGIPVDPKHPGWLLPHLERFADLVEAAERERCYDLIETLVKAEREACARMCDEFLDPTAKGYLRNVAVKIKAAIRARGESD